MVPSPPTTAGTTLTFTCQIVLLLLLLLFIGWPRWSAAVDWNRNTGSPYYSWPKEILGSQIFRPVQPRRRALELHWKAKWKTPGEKQFSIVFISFLGQIKSTIVHVGKNIKRYNKTNLNTWGRKEKHLEPERLPKKKLQLSSRIQFHGSA